MAWIRKFEQSFGNHVCRTEAKGMEVKYAMHENLDEIEISICKMKLISMKRTVIRKTWNRHTGINELE